MLVVGTGFSISVNVGSGGRSIGISVSIIGNIGRSVFGCCFCGSCCYLNFCQLGGGSISGMRHSVGPEKGVSVVPYWG